MKIKWGMTNKHIFWDQWQELHFFIKGTMKILKVIKNISIIANRIWDQNKLWKCMNGWTTVSKMFSVMDLEGKGPKTYLWFGHFFHIIYFLSPWYQKKRQKSLNGNWHSVMVPLIAKVIIRNAECMYLFLAFSIKIYCSQHSTACYFSFNVNIPQYVTSVSSWIFHSMLLQSHREYSTVCYFNSCRIYVQLIHNDRNCI
jgi:hypothetical protein